MKRATTIAALSVLGMLMMIGGLALADIKGSKHDFSDEAWSQDQVCGACHTPHSTEPPKGPPLWEPDADLDRTFGGIAEVENEPGEGTLSCLRCHDGTIASDMTPSAQRRPVNVFHPARFATVHGRSDHPVGVEYPQFEKGYHPTTAVTAGQAVKLPEGRVECISCHDPHNELEFEHMLVMTNSGSALCLTCHKK